MEDKGLNGQRIRKIWDGSNWNDGYLNNKGRFLVWRPDFPNHYHEGYALRYHVLWWLKTGKLVKKGYNLHHINHNKSDDRFENLKLLTQSEHLSYHNKKPSTDVSLVCAKCKIKFIVKEHRIRGRIKEGFMTKFCSLKCYHLYPKSNKCREKHSNSLKLAYAEGRR